MVCSFGDASVNHSTATGAFNAALHSAYQGLPVPLLFVCEDNGLGHQRAARRRAGSSRAYADRPGLRYFAADGSDLADVLDVARAGRRLRPRAAGARRSCTCARSG